VAKTVTEHEEIRRRAESHSGKPAAVRRTLQGDGVGIVRIMFPDAPQSERGDLVEIGWEEFFREFDDRDLALLYDGNGLFSRIVGRDTAERRRQGDHDAAR
jgi:hypothetical protein